MAQQNTIMAIIMEIDEPKELKEYISQEMPELQKYIDKEIHRIWNRNE